MIDAARAAIANVVGSVLDVDPSLAYIPSTLVSASAFIRPARGVPYVSYEAGSFTRPTIALAAVVVAGTQDWEQAAAWLDDAVERVTVAAVNVTSLAPLTSALVVSEVSEPGLIPTSTGNFLAVEIVFAPLFLTDLTLTP